MRPWNRKIGKTDYQKNSSVTTLGEGGDRPHRPHPMDQPLVCLRVIKIHRRASCGKEYLLSYKNPTSALPQFGYVKDAAGCNIILTTTLFITVRQNSAICRRPGKPFLRRLWLLTLARRNAPRVHSDQPKVETTFSLAFRLFRLHPALGARLPLQLSVSSNEMKYRLQLKSSLAAKRNAMG